MSFPPLRAFNVFRLGLLLLPTALLLAASLRYPDASNIRLWLATGFQIAILAAACITPSLRQPTGPSVITLYLIALAWLWWGDGMDDWLTHLTRAILLIVPLAVFGYQTLAESGAPEVRRARILAQRLAQRKDWPTEPAQCRVLPEVKALRAALTIDAAPALALLSHPRLEVRVAALAALEFRKHWQPGQAELVLQAAQQSEHPSVRAAAVAALGNIDDRTLVETLAQFLSDTSGEVRKATLESLLWDTEKRWGWIRFSVRRVLADPLFHNDGPLVHDQLLTPEAIKDLTGWCAEKGVLAARSALTLGAHYNRALTERPEEELVLMLREMLADRRTPAVLRLELGRVLQFHQELDDGLLEKLLDSSTPAPLRLIACETILADHATGARHEAAVSALRDLARLPNREIALLTGDVIQRRLGVDLGLGLGQPLPPIHSRQAAELTRKVMIWATREPREDVEDSRPSSKRATG